VAQEAEEEGRGIGLNARQFIRRKRDYINLNRIVRLPEIVKLPILFAKGFTLKLINEASCSVS
jgi:hypothetical protein